MDTEQRLLECEEALRSTEAEFAAFRERMLAPIKSAEGNAIESLSWDELLGVAVRNLNAALDAQEALKALMEESRPWLESGRTTANPAMARARRVLEAER